MVGNGIALTDLGGIMARFVAKRRNISFEGCAFKNFAFKTNDIDKVEDLRKSSFYNNGFTEIDRDEATGVSLNKPLGKASKEELKRMLATMESEDVEFEKIEESLVVIDEEIKTEDIYKIKDDYENLKIEAKKKGMVWKGFPKKTALIEFLNAEK